MSIGGGAGALLGTASGIGNLAGSLAARLGGSAQSYFQALRPASFRNFPFVSLGSENEFGRRNEVHEYPMRDTPWVEDLGRGTRHFQIVGFVHGDDVIAQRDALINELEKPGPGELVHPSLGRRTVSLMRFRSIERWEKGRYFEFEFEFIEGGPRIYPSSSASTTDLVGKWAAALGLSAALNFARAALTAIKLGAAVLSTVVSTALGWYTFAVNLVGDARNMFKLLANLPGDFGRFSGASLHSSFSKYPSSSVVAGSSVASLTASAVAARANVASAAAAIGAAAQNLSPTTIDPFTSAVQALPTAMLAAIADPADQVRLMTSLAGYVPSGNTTTSAIGSAMASMQSASGDLFRRTAIAAVATASASYQPTSSDDAVAMRTNVVQLIDDEMKTAGDQGEDETYDALRALRAAVVDDLNARGAGLASMRSFSFQASMPALVLANRIYRDATRADDLIAEANPVHPAFFPTTFKALGQ